MDTTNKNKIDRIIRDGYTFKFGEYIKQALELFQRNFFGFLVITFVILLGVMFSSALPYINFFLWIFVVPILGLGYSIAAHKMQKQKATTINDFFMGFEKFQTLAILFGILFGISLLASFPVLSYIGSATEAFLEEYSTVEEMQEFALENPEEYMALFTENIKPITVLLYLIPLIFIHVIYLFAPHFVYFYKFSAWEAMEASRKLIMKKWFTFFGFSIIIGILSMVGIFFFGIGVLITYSIGPLALFTAFSDITQLNDNSVENDILNHLVE